MWVQFGFRVTRSSDFGAARRTGHQFERSGIHYTPFCTIFCCVRPEIWTEWRKGGTERSGQKSLELPASSIAWPNYIVGIWQINSPKLHTHSARKEKTRGGRTAGFQRELSSLQPDNSHKSSQQRRRQDAPGKSAIKICANFVFLLACNWYWLTDWLVGSGTRWSAEWTAPGSGSDLGSSNPTDAPDAY